MAKKLFEDTKWIIKLLNNEKPVNGNKSNLSFFSEFFIKYLLQEFWTRVQKKQHAREYRNFNSRPDWLYRP